MSASPASRFRRRSFKTIELPGLSEDGEPLFATIRAIGIAEYRKAVKGAGLPSTAPENADDADGELESMMRAVVVLGTVTPKIVADPAAYEDVEIVGYDDLAPGNQLKLFNEILAFSGFGRVPEQVRSFRGVVGEPGGGADGGRANGTGEQGDAAASPAPVSVSTEV